MVSNWIVEMLSPIGLVSAGLKLGGGGGRGVLGLSLRI